jgi:hypothetical protein
MLLAGGAPKQEEEPLDQPSSAAGPSHALDDAPPLDEAAGVDLAVEETNTAGLPPRKRAKCARMFPEMFPETFPEYSPKCSLNVP